VSALSRQGNPSPSEAPAESLEPQVVFSLTIEAQEVLVAYTPYWMGGEAPYGHFEFFSPHEPPRRIPVSETGYRSHFAPMHEVEAAPSPQDYAREVALALVRWRQSAERIEEQNAQLPLF
jgi:hypothetical protein